jgi:hypothetical protein
MCCCSSVEMMASLACWMMPRLRLVTAAARAQCQPMRHDRRPLAAGSQQQQWSDASCVTPCGEAPRVTLISGQEQFDVTQVFTSA